MKFITLIIALLTIGAYATYLYVSNANREQKDLKPEIRKIEYRASLLQISQDLLKRVKNKNKADTILEILSDYPEVDVFRQLSTYSKKTAFWLNIHNAMVIHDLRKKGKLYKDIETFLNDVDINIAGYDLSLFEIQNYIVRNEKLNRLNISEQKISFIRNLRTDSVDSRVHYALNCGAKSCPPIDFYLAETLNHQLDVAKSNYLKQEISFNKKKNVVYVTKKMDWFSEDFGGRVGIINLLKKNNIIPKSADPEIIFKEYDWTLNLNNFLN